MEKKKKEEEDNGLCLGRCRGRREEEGWEMLESCKSMTQNDYTRVKREKIYEASPWKRMASFFTSLPPFIHPFLPLFALLLDCSFGQPKLFLFSAERRKLIIYMFQSVLKSECNLPPPSSTVIHPVINSSISTSALRNVSELLPTSHVYCGHICIFFHAWYKNALILDQPLPQSQTNFYRGNAKLWSQNQVLKTHLHFV